MMQNGLNVTINTDDPSVSRITLSHEYRVATELGLTVDVLKQRIMAAAPCPVVWLTSFESNETTRRAAAAGAGG